MTLRKELVAILDDLMSTTDQIHIMLLQKSRDDVGAKSKRDTSVIFAPSGNILVRVRPQQVAEKTTVGNLINS